MGEKPTDPAAPGNRRPPGDGEKWKVNRAVRASDLPAFSRLIMMVLSDIADTGTAELPPGRNPSTAQLARETGIQSLTSVRKHRVALEKAGWILYTPPTVEQQARHKPGTYKLRVPPRRAGQQMTPDAQGRGSEAGPRQVPNRGSGDRKSVV